MRRNPLFTQDHGSSAQRKGRDQKQEERNWSNESHVLKDKAEMFKQMANLALREAHEETADLYDEDTPETVAQHADNEMTELIGRFPNFESAVTTTIAQMIDDMRSGDIDIDDVVSVYRRSLGPDADFSDAEMLLYEYMAGHDTRTEDQAHAINVEYDASEDEAYAINVRINT